MAAGNFPNRNRADNALTIYRDAMRAYIAPILEREHGPDWIRSQVLNATARERNPSSHDRRLQSLQRGTPPRDLIDLAEIPFLIQDNARLFPDLDQSDTRRMHMIRDLRNEIQHADRAGDCAPEEVASLAGLCTLVLERCGLSDASGSIRSLSLGSAAEASEAELREQRERREWDKVRLGGKRPEELTPWEQQRLADIEWEEEWEQRESARKEHEEIAQLADDLDGLRRWFDADHIRMQNYASDYAELKRKEELAQREREEIAQFGDDLDSLRRWFDTDIARRGRHPLAWAATDPQEQARRELESRTQRERRDLSQLEGDTDRLRRWFDADAERRERHPTEHESMLRQELSEKERLRRIAPAAMARLSVGTQHSLALSEDGTIASWGDNDYGQCDVDAPPSIQFIAVSAGVGHSLALRKDGTVICWGLNNVGQCDGPNGRFVAIAAGDMYSIALREDGKVISWGSSLYGQAPAGRFVAVSAAGPQSAALRQDGTVVTWGINRFDKDGMPPGPYTAISVGGLHGIALREDGTVVCRGDNEYGQCDPPPGKYVAVSAGTTCSAALREDGTVACWGLTQGDTPPGRYIAVSVGSGFQEALALREDGTVVRWHPR